MVDGIKILRPAAGDQLAVIGMGVDFPGIQTLDDFLEAMYRGSLISQTESTWQADGCLLRAVSFAIRDCDWDGARHQVIGTLVIGNGVEKSRLNAQAGISGPVVDFAGYSEPLPAMLLQAQDWLQEHEAEAVVLAGAALGAKNQEYPILIGLDSSGHAAQPGSGAAALVIMRKDDAVRLGLRIYALIESMAFADPSGSASLQESVLSCARSALQAAGIKPGDIGCLQALAPGEDRVGGQEIAGLCAAYQGPPNKTSLDSSLSLIGYLEGVNGLAGLVRAGLCLANRLRPGLNGWSGPKNAELWNGSTFYVPTESLTWFHNEATGSRKAAMNTISKEIACAHFILSGAAVPPRIEPVMRKSNAALIPVGGASLSDLVTGIENIQNILRQGASVSAVARDAYLRFRSSESASVAVFLAHNPEEALREIDFGLRGIPAAFEKAQDWQTPAGSYYTPRPLGASSRVTFVYPGAFNSYIGVGKDLFYLFPAVYDHLNDIAQDVGTVLCEEQLYPRGIYPLSKAQVEQAEAALLNDPNAMMVSGSSLSVGLTSIFRDIFQVEPYSALGYSLGENSMMFSLGVWGDGLFARQRLFTSPLFHTRLAGPQNAVRDHWGLPALQGDVQPAEPLWENFLLMSPADMVRGVLETEPRVYLTHINTPRQVVIGGDPSACRRVIARLKCSSLKAPFDYVLHCKAMESEYQALYEIHSLPVVGQLDIKLYSAANDRPFVLTQSEIARAVARDLCSMLDFPRLVETAYAEGARFFIEMGAGSNCAKWIEEILRGKPGLSISANRKGVDDATSILRVLARLISHKIKVNLGPLFQEQVLHEKISG